MTAHGGRPLEVKREGRGRLMRWADGRLVWRIFDGIASIINVQGIIPS